MKRNKTVFTLTGLALAASIALTGCGASANAQGVQAAGANTTATPSANENTYPVGDAIFDGKGYYALALLTDNDPVLKWQPTKVDSAVVGPNGVDQQDFLAAQKVAANYVNEAIQAPPSNTKATPDAVLADYEQRIVSKYFHSGYKYDPTGEKLAQNRENDNGANLYRNEGASHLLGTFLNIDVDKHNSAAFSYDYGKDKERIVTRSLTLKKAGLDSNTTSTLGDFNPFHKDAATVDVGKTLWFQIDADFTSKSLLDGQPLIETAKTGQFGVTLANENGKWVIVDVDNNSYTHY